MSNCFEMFSVRDMEHGTWNNKTQKIEPVYGDSYTLKALARIYDIKINVVLKYYDGVAKEWREYQVSFMYKE